MNTHWNDVYRKRDEVDLTWFEPADSVSFALVKSLARAGDAIVDIGGGASRLVDQLLASGFGPLTVLDLSGEALAVSRQRLGADGADVTWIAQDVTRWKPDMRFALWHDRAAFHFLNEASAREAYVEVMADALEAGGHAVIATFADNGPETCSGLPVTRYTPDALAKELDRCKAGAFELVQSRLHTHVTPKGSHQHFQYSVFRKA